MVQENKTYTQIVRVYGIVQGVGFRPFVSRIADRAGVTGSVANKGSYVEIYVRGRKSQMEAFMDDLEQHPPELQPQKSHGKTAAPSFFSMKAGRS